MKKILIIRFSSIGDIVLTTPVVRCLKKTFPQAEIHYVTKTFNQQFLALNPYISKIHVYNDNLKELIEELKSENFDFVVDLQKNRRSAKVKHKLKRPHKSFNKLNIRKWWFVRTKRNCMPAISIVDRYFQAVEPLHVKNDGQGLDFFLKEEAVNLPFGDNASYVALVCGAQHFTKQIPPEKISYLVENTQQPIVLLGDEKDAKRIQAFLKENYPHVFNACGKLTLNQSAILVKNAQWVITPDTGLMHIAAALRKRIISVWGNTVPEFGMYPYFSEKDKQLSHIFEVKNLPCRPCSKIGFKKCPKGHFNCMQQNHFEEIIKLVNQEN